MQIAGGSLTGIVAAVVEDLLYPIREALDSKDDDGDDDRDDDWWEDRDESGPKVDIDTTDLGSAGPTLAVTVRYEDDRAIDTGSIDVGDLVVAGPGGLIASVRLEDAEVKRLGTEVIATYVLTGPDGSWDSQDNGNWTVSVLPGAVTDGWGNGVGGESDGFKIEIAAPAPTVPPPPPPPVDTAPVVPPAVPAAPIDDGFSGGTPVTSEFVAESAVTLDDGKIVLAGRQGSLADGTSQGVLKRLNADGSLDRSFGKAGVVVTPAGQNIAYFAVALSADGKLVATGRHDGDVVVARYKSNGGVDNQFADGGRHTIDWGSIDTAYAVAIAADGRILVGGGSNGAFGLSRLTATGDTDTSFGARGSALFSLGAGNDNTVGAIAIQSDGRILGAGSVGGSVAVFRLTADGQTDRTFGSGGAAVLKTLSSRTDAGNADYALGLAVQADRGILVANNAGGDFAIERLLFSGDRDRSFGTNGRTTVDFGGTDDADAIVVQQSGDIIVVGTTTAQGGRLAVAALQPGGRLNTSYADGGKLTLEAGVTSSGRALHAGSLVLRAFASARGNDVVVGGSSEGNTSNSTGLRRLNVPGTGLIGHFGLVDGKNKVLRFRDEDGSAISLSLAGGSGQAYYDGTNVQLVLVDVTDRSQLKVVAVGGDNRVSLGNAHVYGSIGTVNAKTADLVGTFRIIGSARKIQFGGLSGGTLATKESIGSLTIRGDATASTVLAGADLGSDHLLGGKGGKADSFAAASIDVIHIRGAVTSSLFAAGLDRVNSRFLDQDDRIIGGEASRIGLVRIGVSIDASSRFVCGSLGSANLPIDIDPTDDDRFVVL